MNHISFWSATERHIMHALALIAAVLAVGDHGVIESGAIVIVALSIGAIIRSKMA